MSESVSTAIALQENFISMSDLHLKMRGSDNPEFHKQFVKTFSDLLFSQNDEMLEKLSKTKPASLMNAVFRATESGASFAKKEISFIPFEIFKTVKEGGAVKKTATGEYEALVIFDINFQKQQILKLANCKKFFSMEVHEGVEILHDLSTGNCVFEGKNDATKPVVGYYANFTTTENEVYDLFMSLGEIVDRAKFSTGFKADNYKSTAKSIHYEKIVVRNLIKIIPKISSELKSVLAWDESSEFSSYELVEDDKKSLETAKKELAENKQPENFPKDGKEKQPEKVVTDEPAPTTENDKANQIQEFF